MKQLSIVLCGLLAACGGAAETTKTGAGSGSGSAAATPAGDVSFEVPVIEIKGVVFEPEAFEPGMPLADKKGLSGEAFEKMKPEQQNKLIETQRKLAQTTKDSVLREAQSAILATMLYRQAKTAAPDAQQKAYTDARDALHDAAQASGKKVDELTLRLLGSYDLLLKDWPGAEQAWADLVKAAPKSPDLALNKAAWAYALLRQYKNADALAVVKDEKLDPKAPELAYVAAWAKWRGGDDGGAWQAISIAHRGWDDRNTQDIIDRDTFIIAARGKAGVDQVTQQLLVLLAKTPADQYGVLSKLGLGAYGFAGKWSEGIATLEKALAAGGDKIPENERAGIRFNEAQFEVPLDAPDQAAVYGKQALEALGKCEKCTADDKSNVALGVYYMGRLFHLIYATSGDIRYYTPAHDLYQAAIPMLPAGKQADAGNDAGKLETTMKNTRAGKGTHDKDAIGVLMQRHNAEVQACYELALVSNPKVGGTVSVSVEADANGAIKGVTTDPKAGGDGMPMVAGCVADHVKTWKLPKRMQAGTTRMKLSYSLAPRKGA
ncbi:MAG TPA: AgmX/PglI C-terminal domain-containing protein [Kofleriaceae bacterium]|jgi:hypothetical protein